MAMKTKRHAKILEIIHQKSVETQEDLLLLLREDGYNVTQATVSRDIKELRLIKALGPDGRDRYSTVRLENENISSKFHSLFADTVLHIDYAGNLVVVKCLSGMAQAACAAMDSMHWDQVVGTLGGEDTFICITKNEEQAVSLTGELKKLLKGG